MTDVFLLSQEQSIKSLLIFSCIIQFSPTTAIEYQKTILSETFNSLLEPDDRVFKPFHKLTYFGRQLNASWLLDTKATKRQSINSMALAY